jgi:hypothetical protein
MNSLKDIDVALLPADGTCTLNADEATEATKYIKPKMAIPYHWGQILGIRANAEKFAAKAECEVKVLSAGETISLDEQYFVTDELRGCHSRGSGNPESESMDSTSKSVPSAAEWMRNDNHLNYTLQIITASKLKEGNCHSERSRGIWFPTTHVFPCQPDCSTRLRLGRNEILTVLVVT